MELGLLALVLKLHIPDPILVFPLALFELLSKLDNCAAQMTDLVIRRGHSGLNMVAFCELGSFQFFAQTENGFLEKLDLEVWTHTVLLNSREFLKQMPVLQPLLPCRDQSR